MVKKHIVCLASSSMEPGRCIAGKEIEGGNLSNRFFPGFLRRWRITDEEFGVGGWIRPVNENHGKGLSSSEYRYKDQNDPRVGDIIKVQMVKHFPHNHQSENWLIDSRVCWIRVGRVAWDHFAGLADSPPALWKNSGEKNDRVSRDVIGNFSSSIHLITVRDIVIRVHPGWHENPHRVRVRGEFTYRGVVHDLAVTDPEIKNAYTEIGTYRIEACYITVSLAVQPFKDEFYYKLIAAIITPEHAGK